MFGRQDDVIKQDQRRDADVMLPDSALTALTAPPATGSQTDSPMPATPAPAPTPVVSAPAPSVDGISGGPATNLADPFDLMRAHSLATRSTTNQPKNNQTDDTPTPSPAPQDEESGQADEPEELSYQESEPYPESEPVSQTPTLLADEPASSNETLNYLSDLHENNPDLLSIKESALQQLSPLVNQLDLSAEDKFKTLMMLIQASDNQELIPLAYEAAQKIETEKVRAQALLDVVNEINYFTKNNQPNT